MQVHRSWTDNTCVLRLQMVLHSILSTRIVIHTATVLRQDIVDSRATVAQHQRSTRMMFAENIIELVPEGEEFQETRR